MTFFQPHQRKTMYCTVKCYSYSNLPPLTLLHRWREVWKSDSGQGRWHSEVSSPEKHSRCEDTERYTCSSLLSSNFTLPLYCVTASALDMQYEKWVDYGCSWVVCWGGGWVEFGVGFGGSKSVMVGLCWVCVYTRTEIMEGLLNNATADSSCFGLFGPHPWGVAPGVVPRQASRTYIGN